MMLGNEMLWTAIVISLQYMMYIHVFLQGLERYVGQLDASVNALMYMYS